MQQNKAWLYTATLLTIYILSYFAFRSKYTVTATNQVTNKSVDLYLINPTKTIDNILYYFYWLPGITDEKITGCDYVFISEPHK
jgi:hypothetical protein